MSYRHFKEIAEKIVSSRGFCGTVTLLRNANIVIAHLFAFTKVVKGLQKTLILCVL